MSKVIPIDEGKKSKSKSIQPKKKYNPLSYCLSHCCVSPTCMCFDFCLNEILYAGNGGYIEDPDDKIFENVPKKKIEQKKFEFVYHKEKSPTLCNKISAFGAKCFGKLVDCFWTCAGKPETAAWDYKSITSPHVDPKRIGILTGETQDKAFDELITNSDNGDVIQIGDMNIHSIQGVTSSNIAHCLIVIDKKWLETGIVSVGAEEKKKNLMLYQSTINKIQNGVNGRSYREALNMYQFSSIKNGSAWAFLLKLSDEAKKEFNSNRQFVRDYLSKYIFLKNGKSNARYSMSTIARDYFIIWYMSGCWSKRKKEIVVAEKNEKGDVEYKKMIQTLVDFNDDPNFFDRLFARCCNQYKNSQKYVACAKFQAGIHQAGGLISEDTNINHVTNDANCWPDYFHGYYKIEVPPRLGTNKEHYKYSEYLLNFGKLSKNDYEKCMNGYFFDCNDYLNVTKNPDFFQNNKENEKNLKLEEIKE